MTEAWCVLRSGGEYSSQHVARLSAQVERHGGGRLHCLTDTPWAVADTTAHSVAVEPMHLDWPGWFAKLELYLRPGPILYLDLDTNIIGPLDAMLAAVETRDLIVARNWHATMSAEHVISTAVVGWRGDASSLARQFATDPAGYQVRYGDRRRWREPGRGWGDQGFVRDHWQGERWAFWQDILPTAMEHFKYGQPAEADALIVSGGKPRPWDPGGADERLRKQQVQV